MTYNPLTGPRSNPFAQIPDGITAGSKVKVIATGYRSGEPNVVLESDPVTILTRPAEEQGYFEKNYPLSKLMQEVQNSSPGDVIDLENKGYWLNINEAVGEDGITYPSVNEFISQSHFFEINHSIEIKNGTIILFEECNLTQESPGVYSCSYNPDGRSVVQIFDPGENNVNNPPRFAKYPPQPSNVFTTYTTDENSFLFDKDDDSPDKTGNLILLPNEDTSCERCALSGIFVNAGYTAGLSLANDIKDMLDIVSTYSGASDRTEAAINLPMFYKAVPNIIKVTSISSYEESVAGLTLMFNDTYEREDEDEAHYLKQFNFFGSGAFLNYGDGPSENVSVYATDIVQNELTYKPARGECLQLWRSVDSYYAEGSSNPGYASGCFFITRTQDYDESTDTFPDTVTLDNITFVGNAAKEGSYRGKVIYAGSPCNFIIKNCNAYYGEGFLTMALAGGELLLENTLIAFPIAGSVGVTPFGEKTIRNCRFVGNQQRSGISTTNTMGDLFTGYINVYGNYFDLGTSNHGQGISSYASAWARYKIWGNIFHNCQRSIAFQHGDWLSSSPESLIDNEVDMGTGYVLANNLVYHDQDAVTPLNGQLGVVWNSRSPQSSILLTVDDPLNQYDFSGEQVKAFRFQRFNGTNFEDINFAPEFGLSAEDGHVLNIDYNLTDYRPSPPWNSSSSADFNAGAYDYDYDYEHFYEKSAEFNPSERNYFTGNRRFSVSVEGKDETSNTGYDANVFLGLIQQYEEPLYVRTIPEPGNESEYSFEGIPVLNVQFFKDVPLTEIFRNTFIIGYSYANYIEENGDDYNIVRGSWVNLTGSGRNKDTDGDGTADIVVNAAGSNGPLYMKGNIVYNVNPGLSGGDINNPNYDITSRRLFGGVTFEDNIILRPDNTSLEDVWIPTNDVLRETIPDYTYFRGLTHIYDNLQNGDPTPKAEFQDRGILFTHNGLPTGIPIYPDLRELRTLDLNWADAYKPVHPDLLRNYQPEASVEVDFIQIAEVANQIISGETFEVELVADTWDPSKTILNPVFGVSDDEFTEPTTWEYCDTKTVDSIGRDDYSAHLPVITYEDGYPEPGDKTYTIFKADTNLGPDDGEKWIWVKSSPTQTPRQSTGSDPFKYDSKVRKLRVFRKNSVITEIAGSTAELEQLLTGPSADIVDIIECDFVSSNTDSTENNIKRVLRETSFSRTSERMLTIKPTDARSNDCVISLERWETGFGNNICKNLCLDGFVFGSLDDQSLSNIFSNSADGDKNLWINNGKFLSKYHKASGITFGKTEPGETGDWALADPNGNEVGYTKNGSRTINGNDFWGHRNGENREGLGRSTEDGSIQNGDYVIANLYDKPSWIAAGNSAGNVQDGEYVIKLNTTRTSLYHTGGAVEIPSEFRDVSGYSIKPKIAVTPTDNFGFRDIFYATPLRTFNDGADDDATAVVVSGDPSGETFDVSKYVPTATPNQAEGTYSYSTDGTEDYYIKIGFTPSFMFPQTNYPNRRVCDNAGSNSANKILDSNPRRWGEWGAADGNASTDGPDSCQWLIPVWRGEKINVSITNSCYCGLSVKHFVNGTIFKNIYVEDCGSDVTFGQDAVVFNLSIFRPRSHTGFSKEDTNHLDFYQYIGNSPSSSNFTYKGVYIYSESISSYQFGMAGSDDYTVSFNNYYDNVYAVKSQAEFNTFNLGGRYHNYRLSNSDLGAVGRIFMGRSNDLTNTQGVFDPDDGNISSFSNFYIDNVELEMFMVADNYWDPSGTLPLTINGFPRGTTNAVTIRVSNFPEITQEVIDLINGRFSEFRVSFEWPKHYEGVYWADTDTLPLLTNNDVTISNIRYSNS